MSSSEDEVSPTARPISMFPSSRLVEAVIRAPGRAIGGFAVRRALPTLHRRRVGPFVFLDHMGPAELPPGRGLDVGPHPHIGLATVTYLFEGTILHRDSVGSARAITPGAVNWMTAGRGCRPRWPMRNPPARPSRSCWPVWTRRRCANARRWPACR